MIRNIWILSLQKLWTSCKDADVAYMMLQIRKYNRKYTELYNIFHKISKRAVQDFKRVEDPSENLHKKIKKKNTEKI